MDSLTLIFKAMSKKIGDKLYESWTALPPWARGVISLVGTAGLVWGGYELFQWNEKRIAAKTSNAVSDASKDMVKDLAKTGQKLSFPEANYLSTVNLIVKLLSGCETTATEAQVVDEIAKVVKNKIDWYHLVSVFGNKDIEDCVAFSKTNYDLTTLVKEQLDYIPTGLNVIGVRRWGNDTTGEILAQYLSKFGITL
jgi:hypothetical protein